MVLSSPSDKMCCQMSCQSHCASLIQEQTPNDLLLYSYIRQQLQKNKPGRVCWVFFILKLTWEDETVSTKNEEKCDCKQHFIGKHRSDLPSTLAWCSFIIHNILAHSYQDTERLFKAQ